MRLVLDPAGAPGLWSRLCAWIGLGLSSGCAADLLPGELVVPGEVAATSYRGSDGALLGAGVALRDGALLVGAPGLGQVLRADSGQWSFGETGLGRWVWWDGPDPRAALAGDGVYAVGGAEAELLWTTPGVVAFDAGSMADGARVVGATPHDLLLWSERGELVASLAQVGVQRVAIGRERVLMIVCVGADCEALAWHAGTDTLSSLGPAGDGGAVVGGDDVAWGSDPELADAFGSGWVCSEDGACHAGLEGDHLGRSLCATHASGVFNTWIVPARLRVVPLSTGPVLAIDRGAPSRSANLHSQGGMLAIGLPSDGVNARGEGRALLVEID